MAKISTYPNDSSVSLGDRLIGTDVDNLDATKNFTIADIFALGTATTFVPYTGATQNVDLGLFNLDCSLLDAQAVQTKTLNVTLGPSNFGGNINHSGVLNTGFIQCQFGMNLLGGGLGVGFAGFQGNTGDVLLSQGMGVPPSWSALSGSYVPYTGATANVNLGTFGLEATGVDVKTGPLELNGAPGVIGQIPVSGGPGTNPVWLGQGTSGQILASQGAGANPAFVNMSSYSKHATYFHGLSQVALANTDTAVRFNSISSFPLPSGITVINDGFGQPTIFSFSEAGIYNIQIRLNALKQAGGTDQQIYSWIELNGVAVTYSGCRKTLKDSGHVSELTSSFNMSLAIGDQLQVYWWVDSTDIILQTSTGTPTEVPSSFINIFRI